MKAVFTVISILFFTTFFTSCKPTSSVIITSKAQAEKLGKYKSADQNKELETAEIPVENSKEIERLIISKKSKTKTNKTNLNLEPKEELVELPQTELGAEKIKTNTQTEMVYANTGNTGEDVISNAFRYEGVRYRSGGTSFEGVDCSGLVIASFRETKVQLPRTANEMSKRGFEIGKIQAMKGDLIFFRTNGNNSINHVGMVIETTDDGEVKFIHSSSSRGVMVSSTREDYYKKAFAQINRVIE
jgi:peptidoglycan DL-endopeptidase LytE